MRILRNDTAGLVIDIQDRLYPHIYNNEQIAANTAKLISGLKILEIPLMVSEQYTKGLGFTIPVIKSALGDIDFMEKKSFSCCDDPGIMDLVQKTAKKNIIIAGIEAHVCVLQTCIDLLEKGFQAVIIEDCTSSRSESDKNIALKRMEREGAIISSYESILFELTRYSGSDRFKAISQLVK